MNAIASKSNEQPKVQIREPGTVIVLMLVLLSIPPVFSTFSHGHSTIALSIAAIVGITAFTLSSLQILINNGRLRLSFAGFLTLRNVALLDIESVRRMTPPILAGFGIRFLSGGTLYSVGAGEAIEVQMNDGSRFYVGVSDPARVTSIITSELLNTRTALSGMLALNENATYTNEVRPK